MSCCSVSTAPREAAIPRDPVSVSAWWPLSQGCTACVWRSKMPSPAAALGCGAIRWQARRLGSSSRHRLPAWTGLPAKPMGSPGLPALERLLLVDSSHLAGGGASLERTVSNVRFPLPRENTAISQKRGSSGWPGRGGCRDGPPLPAVTSLPAANHPARDLALSPVHTELPGRGGATGRARPGGFLWIGLLFQMCGGAITLPSNTKASSIFSEPDLARGCLFVVAHACRERERANTSRDHAAFLNRCSV